MFNYSKVELSKHMENVLNKGLNFCPLPPKPDTTQLLTDLKRFERIMVWKEFHSGKENDKDRQTPLFKSKKTNFPKNHPTPKGLKEYIGAVKSDLLNPYNRNKVVNNLTEDETDAINHINKLQKERQITVKKCDKGAGIIVLDFEEYMKASREHLNSETPAGEKCYEKVDERRLLEASSKVNAAVEEGKERGILSKDEYTAMKVTEDKPGRFYGMFKVHKKT